MSIQFQKDGNQIVTLTMDMPGRSTNVINESFAGSLQTALEKLDADKSISGVIITSAKSTFMAGGDIDWLVQLHDPAAAFQAAQSIKAIFRRLEKLGKPVVAAINGSVLGGGLELALACHRRIAIADKSLKIGFPEVTLGLIPGAGGIPRLTRLLGLQDSLPYLMDGKQVNPVAAVELGIIDELAQNNKELLQRSQNWILEEAVPYQPWDTPRYRLPGGSPSNPKVAQMLAIAPAMLKKKTRGNYPAPQAVLSAAVEGSLVDFDTALRIESRYFAQIAAGQVAKNMINAFWFQLNKVKAGESRPNQFPRSKRRKVGILGAGMMGHGIAYVSAYAGIEVVLKDVSLEKAQAGKDAIVKIIEKRVSRRKMKPDQAQMILDKIKCTAGAADLQGCDLIIEAVFENREIKAKVTAEAEAQINEKSIFASNTSTLPITSLAANSARPQNFIGLHFFSPVQKMKLVEIIRGKYTSEETLAKAYDYVLQINKIPIVVNDSRGFYTSRVFMTYLKEGLALLYEGEHPRAVESAALQAGMPVGPLALADEVSLSLMVHISEQTKKDLAAEGKVQTSHPADRVLDIMVQEFGRTGKANGAGFYEYPEGKTKFLWPALKTQFVTKDTPLQQEQMIERLMFIQALETVRCYEEGVVQTVADANIGSIFGWGFAPFKGGTLQYINDYGLVNFVGRSQELADQNGPRFLPPSLLKTMARDNRSF